MSATEQTTAPDGTYRCRVEVMLKPAVLDPQGQAIQGALGGLGFTGVESVRAGRIVELTVKADSPAAAEAEARRMAEVLLANPVIEKFQVSVA